MKSTKCIIQDEINNHIYSKNILIKRLKLNIKDMKNKFNIEVDDYINIENNIRAATVIGEHIIHMYDNIKLIDELIELKKKCII